MRKLVSVRAAALASALLAAAGQAHAQATQSQGALADPQGSSAVLSGVMWLQGTLLGNVATAVAVMAVAAVGFMMLTGRMNWRYGATVILGCFILFGATTIVSGIRTAAGA
ncbi:type VI secretion protein [Caulobacter radicis]|uniref:TrbC/VirB2 family protein n=1 Tax=Caulobacter radicis TaxID=2172650 RepID=UPI000D56923C|nr:TrbC/VirB2 family protein [Caulobacter radicis]PVM83341.1 type VI secretion protein [Caulobacter radicis]